MGRSKYNDEAASFEIARNRHRVIQWSSCVVGEMVTDVTRLSNHIEGREGSRCPSECTCCCVTFREMPRSERRGPTYADHRGYRCPPAAVLRCSTLRLFSLLLYQ